MIDNGMGLDYAVQSQYGLTGNKRGVGTRINPGPLEDLLNDFYSQQQFEDRTMHREDFLGAKKPIVYEPEQLALHRYAVPAKVETPEAPYIIVPAYGGLVPNPAYRG